MRFFVVRLTGIASTTSPEKAERRRHRGPSLLVQGKQPLIGFPFEEQGHAVVRYFAREEEADQAVADQEVQDALSLAGAWSHLD